MSEISIRHNPRPSFKAAVFLLLLLSTLFSLWWINRAIHSSPNLLTNPDFEARLSGWEVFEAGGTAEPKPAIDDAGNTVLAMRVPYSDTETWVAAKKRIDGDIIPLQGYNLTVNYRLPHQGQSPARVVLRVAQLDQAGDLVRQDEISDPNPLATRLDDNGELTWSTLKHSFVTDRQTRAVEIYIALVGHQATVVEVDHLAFAPVSDTTWPGQARTGLAILFINLLLGGAISYARRVDFAAHPFLRRAGKWGAIVAVNVIVFFVLAELVALGIYFFRDGVLFYTHKRNYQPIGVAEENRQSGNELPDNLTSRRFHPFFGFVVKPGIDERFNNYGFISPYDYPYVKNDENEFIIAVFGGSVAEIFSQNENRERFIQNLKQNDFFKSKEIIILNFAAGAYKQPQQLMVLSYFLSIGQEFDMVINIDGFNEASMSYINYQDGVDVSMPVSYIMLPLVNLTNQTTPSPKTIETLARINRDRARLNNLARTINGNYLASVNFILEQYHTFIHNRYSQELATLEQVEPDTFSSLIYVNPADNPMDEATVFERIAQNWANSSIIMNQILTGRGIPYFHFLQPNQYYSQKIFSQEEARIALNPNQISKAGVEKVYPRMVEKFDTLRQGGVNFHSGLDIFNDETEAVYGDDCCHYNSLGNKILADFIARAILEEQP